MSRLFDGVDDVMTFGQPSGPPAMNDALTLVAVVRIMTTSDNAWQSIMEFERADTTPCCYLGRGAAGAGTGELRFINTNGIGFIVLPITDADGWMVIADIRSAAAGTTGYKRPIGSASTVVAGGALADGLAWNAGGVLKVGGDDDFANIRLAAFGYVNGTALTQGQLDAIDSTQDLIDLGFTAVYDDSDAFATDLVGSADRTAIVGTVDDADDPAGWTYFGGGGTSATVTSVPADGIGDVPAPTVSAGANVTAPPADGTGSMPIAGNEVSSEVVPPPAAASGDLPAPAVSGTGAATVDAVPADGTGDVPTPSASAGATLDAPPADGSGDVPAPTASAGATLTPPPMAATGVLRPPAVSGDAATLVLIDLPTYADLEDRATTLALETRLTTAGLEARVTTLALETRETTGGLDG